MMKLSDVKAISLDNIAGMDSVELSNLSATLTGMKSEIPTDVYKQKQGLLNEAISVAQKAEQKARRDANPAEYDSKAQGVGG